MNRQKNKRETEIGRGSFCECVCVCVCVWVCGWVGATCARVGERLRVYEYVGVIPYMDATFQALVWRNKTQRESSEVRFVSIGLWPVTKGL